MRRCGQLFGWAWGGMVTACLVFAGPANAENGRRPLDVPPVGTTYVKVIDGAEEDDFIYRCNERFDLAEYYVTAPQTPVYPGDYGYIRQYDAVISANILCYGYATGGGVTGYMERPAYDLSDFHNMDGSPLQVWGVKGFCYDTLSLVDDPEDIPKAARKAPRQVILLCLDHRAPPGLRQ